MAKPLLSWLLLIAVVCQETAPLMTREGYLPVVTVGLSQIFPLLPGFQVADAAKQADVNIAGTLVNGGEKNAKTRDSFLSRRQERDVAELDNNVTLLENLDPEAMLQLMTELCEQRWNENGDPDHDQVYCNSTYDRVLCWPTTLAGTTAVEPCPPYFNDIKYHDGNATKHCYPNGTWELKTNYGFCVPDYRDTRYVQMDNYVIRCLYYVGFTLSTVSCIVALFIFLYFRCLRCARNKIHSHLIITFVLRNVIWFIMNDTFPILIEKDRPAYQVICKAVVTLFNYAQVTNIFWMLVEGLYLHLMIVWAFSIDKVKFWMYNVLGWGVPAVIVLVWAVVKHQLQNEKCWFPVDSSVENAPDYEWIYIVPVLLVLLINIIFLISIVVVLVTKMRASNTMLTRQYKMAVKATVILLPLLGGTYILFLCNPQNKHLLAEQIFTYANAILQSTQGLAVTTFYCFFNGEVRATIRARYQRWHDGRSFATRYTRTSVATNGESIMRSSFQQNGVFSTSDPEKENLNHIALDDRGGNLDDDVDRDADVMV